jgi:hypothetical protein
MGKKRDKCGDEWQEAKRRCGLSDEDVRMARELGLKPRSLIKNIPAKSQPWKMPVREWIRDLYAKRFGDRRSPSPDTQQQSSRYAIRNPANLKEDDARAHYTPISIEAVAAAVRTVLGMNIKEKEALCDQIHADQPHIFLTTVALSQSGVSLAKLDHSLHLLMVVYLAFRNAADVRLPAIGLDMIDDAYKKLASMMKYLAAEPDKRMWNLTATSYPEPNLLAYLVGYLRDHNFHVETNEHAKVISVAKMSLDAFVAARKKCAGVR